MDPAYWASIRTADGEKYKDGLLSVVSFGGWKLYYADHVTGAMFDAKSLKCESGDLHISSMAVLA